MGGALPTVNALTAPRMTIMRFFYFFGNSQETHGATQYSVNKQTNNLFNVTPLGADIINCLWELTKSVSW